MKLRTANMWGMIEVPETKDFLTNITGLKDVATTIALIVKQETIVVTKSTVLDGTNGRLRQIIEHNKLYHILNRIDSNLILKKVNQFHLQRFIWKLVRIVD